ncbi:hypothetical protein PoB_003388200 [Plakobranchus ocellatus]|uniref:SMB domain-containing protein n=1 Tax=Plakobranchus ocellatus TaxID=259542 RepID=A0AAV4AKG2_9GAST|nr:hypothetical protein PoB_003388200 [Plakobranchus ocellatus]
MAGAQAHIIVSGKLNIKPAMVFVGLMVLQTSVLSLQEVSALRLSKPTTQGVDPTPFVTSMVNYPVTLPSSLRCSKLAAAVAHQKQFCKSQTANAYMELAKAQFTCEDRCGDTPVFGKDLLNCACDEVCIVYGDCCQDISSVCPQIHATGKARYAHAMNKVTPSCHANNFAVLRESAPRCLSSATPAAGTAETTQPVTGTSEDYADVVSIPLKNIFGSFKFRDMSLNVMSDNFGTFELLAKPSSVPLAVPQEASLQCAGVSSKHFGSAASLFRLCTARRVTDVASPLERNCKVYQIMTCNCEDGEKFEDHLHHVCMGENLTSLNQHTFKNFLPLQAVNRPSDPNRCTIFT